MAKNSELVAIHLSNIFPAQLVQFTPLSPSNLFIGELMVIYKVESHKIFFHIQFIIITMSTSVHFQFQVNVIL